LERRKFPRFAVDCPVQFAALVGSVQLQGTLTDLSLAGCRIFTEHRFEAGVQTRIEIYFRIRGICFRLAGVSAGKRPDRSFAVTFTEMPAYRRAELAEILTELAEEQAAQKAKADKITAAALPQPAVTVAEVANALPIGKTTTDPQQGIAFKAIATAGANSLRQRAPDQRAPDLRTPGPSTPSARFATPTPPSAKPVSASSPAQRTEPPAAGAANPGRPTTNRRGHERHSVYTPAKLLLVRLRISMPGCVLNLSESGCRLRTDEPFNVGIYVRAEAEFYLHGLPFRIGGVTQAIIDKNTIGIRFLEMSDRCRAQLKELIEEISAGEREGGLAPQ
jgi:c-di-GMP-binding flagellar brake protein YcgR